MNPDVVYKFVTPEMTETMLSNKSVRYTPLADLNDPAESPMFNGDELLEVYGSWILSHMPRMSDAQRGAVARFMASRNSLSQTAIMSKKWGILCLSGIEALSHSPMWSLYAGGHKGVAVGLSSDCNAIQGFNGLKEVNYGTTRPAGFQTFQCKLECWRSEREFRAFKLLSPDSSSTDPNARQLLLEHFDPTDIKDVVLGCRCGVDTWRFVTDWLKANGLDGLAVRHCVLDPAGLLSVISVPTEAVTSLFECEAREMPHALAEEERIWKEHWNQLGGRKAR